MTNISRAQQQRAASWSAVARREPRHRFGLFEASKYTGALVHPKRHRRWSCLGAWSVMVAGLSIFAFCLAGCSAPERKPDLIIINGPEPESLDPAMITGQADGRVVSSLFEGLTRFDPRTAEPIPGLAERWEISEDGRKYKFYLRPGVVWSTGEPIRAEDVVYSWRRVLDPATACEYAALLFFVTNAEAFAMGTIRDSARVGLRANGLELEVDLNEPTPFFLGICALPTTCVVPRQAIEKWSDRWIMKQPLPVSGAYELESWRLNDKIRLKKNPRYWDAASTRSERIDLLPCQTANTALNLYETGQVDIVWDKELVPTELMGVLRQREDFHSFDYLGSYFFRFNVTRKPFDDARVRRALALAIDRKSLVERITKAGEKPAAHLVPEGLPNYQPARGLDYNPDEARRLLAEAGFPEGKGFPVFRYLYNNTGKVHEQFAVELQAAWRRELGLRMELQKMEWKVFLNAQSMLEYDVSRSSWIGDYNDPNTFLDLFMSNNSNNRTGWKNPRYDGLVREANAQRDPVVRANLLRKAEGLLVEEEVPIVPIYIYSGLEYYDARRIEGVWSNLRSEHPLRTIGRRSSLDSLKTDF